MSSKNENTPDQPIKAKTWLRITLFVSLTLNILVVGIVVGMFWHGPPEHHVRQSSDRLTNTYLRALTNAEKRNLHEAMRAQMPMMMRHQHARSDFRGVLEALRAEPFDANRLSELIDAQLSRGQHAQELGRELLITQITQMSEVERSAYADRIENMLARMRETRSRPGPVHR